MKLLDRIRERLFYFFHVETYLRFQSRSTFGKFVVLNLMLHAALIAALFLLFFLTVFLPQELIHNSYDPLYPASEIVQVDVCHLDQHLNYSPGTASEKTPETVNSALTVVTSLTPAQTDMCIEELKKLDTIYPFGTPFCDLHNGVLRIQYRDGSFDWISALGSASHNASENEFRSNSHHFDTEEFQAFLIQYGYPPS